MGRVPWIVIPVLVAGAVLAPPLAAQTAISTDGVIESTSGGFRFPDGSVQTTAAGGCPTLDPSDEMVEINGLCIDKYEASIWDAHTGGNPIPNGTPLPCDVDGQDCDNIWARSVAGVEPRHDISWFQAQQALANSGKRLPTNAEWQLAVAGTPDPDPDDTENPPGPADCNIDSGTVALTGARTSCVSRWGAHDMIGNLWEYVADWDIEGEVCANWGSDFGDDVACIGPGSTTAHAPAAVIRGGSHVDGSDAGAFAFHAVKPTAYPGVGFRGAK